MDDLIRLMPQQPPFRFIDRITYVDDNRIEGTYRFRTDHDFYKGHFPGCPVTPGVILIEVMAQIGLVAFGIHLLSGTGAAHEVLAGSIPVMASADIRFHKQVPPGERVHVLAEKELFRHGKLVCRVQLRNDQDTLMASGSICGFIADKGGPGHATVTEAKQKSLS